MRSHDPSVPLVRGSSRLVDVGPPVPSGEVLMEIGDGVQMTGRAARGL